MRFGKLGAVALVFLKLALLAKQLVSRAAGASRNN